MSATTVWAGLAERLQTVVGVENIILGEPSTAHALPCLYGALRSVTRSQDVQVTSVRYVFLLRLIVLWQERAEAEAELLSFVNSIPASIDADATLGGRLGSGMARVSNGTAGFMTMNGTVYRIIDFTADVLEKAGYRSGI